MVLCIAHIQTDVAEDAMSSAGRCPCGLPISLGRYRLLGRPAAFREIQPPARTLE
jgi:hypothetical protein